MLDFLKNLKNNVPIVTPNAERQQANLDALQTVMDYQNLIKSDTQNAGFSPQSLELINKIGAENIANGVGQGLNNGVPEIASWIDQYNNGAGRNNPLGNSQAPVQQQDPNTILQGTAVQKADPKTNILSALKDLKAGYMENVTNKFDPNNLFNNQIETGVQKPSEQLVNYQNSLRNQGIDENIVNAVAQGKNNGNKDIANWITQNPDALKPVMETKDKSIMNRVGEGIGTAMRFADSPAGKAMIVAGLVGATGGSPANMAGYGLKTGLNAQQVQMRNDIYRQKLKSIGYSDADLESIKGYIGGDEYKNISDGMYKEGMLGYRDRMADIAGYKADADADYKRGTLGVRQGMLDVARQNAGTNAKRANIYQQIANRGGASGKPPGAKGSGAKNPMYGKHLAEYNAILQSGDQAKINYAQNKFIETYGEDPAKALKQESDILQLLDALENE